MWGALIDTYFKTTNTILLVCVLIDARIPTQKKDLDMLSYAQEHKFEVECLLTKTDKCTHNQVASQIKTWQTINAKEPIVTSSKHKIGIKKVLDIIFTYLA